MVLQAIPRAVITRHHVFRRLVAHLVLALQSGPSVPTCAYEAPPAYNLFKWARCGIFRGRFCGFSGHAGHDAFCGGARFQPGLRKSNVETDRVGTRAVNCEPIIWGPLMPRIYKSTASHRRALGLNRLLGWRFGVAGALWLPELTCATTSPSRRFWLGQLLGAPHEAWPPNGTGGGTYESSRSRGKAGDI